MGNTVAAQIELSHNRLVYLNDRSFKEVYNHDTDFPRLSGDLDTFHPCRIGKATKKSFHSHFKHVS